MIQTISLNGLANVADGIPRIQVSHQIFNQKDFNTNHLPTYTIVSHPATKSGLKLCRYHLDPTQDSVRPEVCGWCDFKAWIKKQKLPAELKRYVLNVLNYLGKNSYEFRGRLWEDDEEWKEEEEFMDFLDKHMKHLHGQETSSSEDESSEEYLWSTDQGEVSSDTEEVVEDLHLRLEEEEGEGQNDEGEEDGDDSGHPCMTQ